MDPAHKLLLTSSTLNAGRVDLLQRILSPNGEDYAYFDFTATDRLFQEPTGPAPADGAGEVIGLAIGRAKQGSKTLDQVLAEQTNRLVPGAWTLGSAGGTSTATESPVGTLNITGDGTNSARADQPFATEVGKLYQIKATTSGPIALNIGTTVGGGQIFSGLFSGGAATNAFYFVATTTTTHIRFYKSGAGLTLISDVFARVVPSHYAFQSVTNFKPQLQAFGAKFDGSDDNLLSDWLAQAGENSIIAQVDVPVTNPSPTSAQVIAGTDNASFTGRLWLGITQSGQVGGGCGANNSTQHFGSADLRGTTVVIAISINGSIVKLFDPVSGEASSVAQNGNPITSVPLRIGSNNPNNAASNFFGGSIKRIALSKKAITLTQFQRIAASWAA